ncbi:MAG: tetratricopeptide repeat protein [Cytophagales bacterium]|nr:tetratricopeptide repeat protein [Cytophagales bacterium]
MKLLLSSLFIALCLVVAQANAQAQRRPKSAPVNVNASSNAASATSATATTATTATTNPNIQTAQTVMDQVDPPPQIKRGQLASSVDPDVLRGYKALQLNQFSPAREAYSQALARNPTQRDALLGIAYAHYALGNTEQALSTLRRLIELYPRDSAASSAIFLISGGDLQAEESRFQSLLERSEHPAALHYTLGVLYFDQDRFGEAERAFSRACAMEPEQPDYAYNQALALDRLGRTRDAARQYVLALNLSNQTNAVFNRDIARARLRILTATP